ncbi:hypothetical protein [Serratia sp. DD3]|uniref:hypothetical protein n=1 Tax=Serratia sp. DD3 TaxID=1410619 RepID=UPI0003C5048F|nr:hypothetical protein [Serratia sp. DD3]KEY59558.1 hypothetical protein SRDD_15050 [Serratia sp. DD3]
MKLARGHLHWGWQHLHSPTAVEQQLVASIAPLPELSRPVGQLGELREPDSLVQRQAESLVQPQADQQLAQLLNRYILITQRPADSAQ